MNGAQAIDGGTATPAEFRRAGIDALVKALGYFVFLWFGRDFPGNVRQGWRRIGLRLTTAVFLCLVVWSGIKLHANFADEASTHEVFWPPDSAGARYLRPPVHHIENVFQVVTREKVTTTTTHKRFQLRRYEDRT